MNFFIFLNMGPYGSENFKTLLLQLQIIDIITKINRILALIGS